MQERLWIYRPILAGKCTMEGVVSGAVSIELLMELNALLDMSEAYQAYSSEVANKRKSK